MRLGPSGSVHGILAERFRKMAGAGDGADFDGHTVAEIGAALRDGGRFLEAGNIEEEITGDGFLRFGERTVDEAFAAITGDDATGRLQWIAADRFPLLARS